MPKMSKQARAREFNAASRKIIKERDLYQCIFCQIGYHMEDKRPKERIYKVLFLRRTHNDGTGMAGKEAAVMLTLPIKKKLI